MRKSIYEQADISYCVFNPTGNITILVETPVPVSRQPSVASRLMELEPESEQVGFLSYPVSGDPAGCPGGASCDIALRMAGGEFCGNATMCAAVYAAMKAGVRSAEVVLRVSGAPRQVRARVDRLADGSWEGTVEMPKPERVEEIALPGAGILPVVSFDGISHVISEQPIERRQAEESAKLWCSFLGSDAIGLMFLDEKASSLLPLVYVPAANTLCWENSCASGTTAVGAFLALREGLPLTMALRQPGGSLTVSVGSDGALSITGIVK